MSRFSKFRAEAAVVSEPIATVAPESVPANMPAVEPAEPAFRVLGDAPAGALRDRRIDADTGAVNTRDEAIRLVREWLLDGRVPAPEYKLANVLRGAVGRVPLEVQSAFGLGAICTWSDVLEAIETARRPKREPSYNPALMDVRR